MSIAALLSAGMTLVDKFIPDPQAKADHQLKLTELAQKGDLAELEAYVTLMSGQLEINKEEAKSGSFFVAGWRPAIGWTCAIALAAAYIPKAIMITALWAAQAYMMLDGCDAALKCDITTFILPPFPDVGLTDLIGLLMSMLGIGAMRSYDKMQRTDTKRVE